MMELKTKYMKKQQTTLSKDLKRFQLLLYRNFKDYENDDGMRLVSNQMAKLCGTAKTHKLEN